MVLTFHCRGFWEGFLWCVTGTYFWLFHYLAKFVCNCKIKSHFIITCTWNLAWPWSKLNVCVCKLCVFMCESINSEISWLNIKMQIIPPFPTHPSQLSFSINILSSLSSSLPPLHNQNLNLIFTFSFCGCIILPHNALPITLPFGWLTLSYFLSHLSLTYLCKAKKLS